MRQLFDFNFDELSRDDLIYILKRVTSSLEYLKDLSVENKEQAEKAEKTEDFRALDYYSNRSHALKTAYDQVISDINSGLKIIGKVTD
ncbi:hypothetical protein Desaci_3025 [Desulfosporosinus acidiphilus SJ4]|uniref:Uncharacterized protein n=1 Tax=Desulfosporosinus acidiphilus (strain DSM 22704 / JCM 16185 / SJ4) TaxID=646529 RepID=I4D809_DESAJ|nr:hypothetical protein [Desulfosporosinus acidiphilus]AFM41933.1 hypothetical protein Desaci_3025 [Desulfosporosinus acidiphilus SJ4]